MSYSIARGTGSGGKMTPAVTVGVLAAGAMGVGEAIGYIVSQLIGGVAGALLLRIVLGGAETSLGMPALAHNLALGATSLTITPEAGFMIEALLAFFLVTVVLSTAVAGRPRKPAPPSLLITPTLHKLLGGAPTRDSLYPAPALRPARATGKFNHCLVL